MTPCRWMKWCDRARCSRDGQQLRSARQDESYPFAICRPVSEAALPMGLIVPVRQQAGGQPLRRLVGPLWRRAKPPRDMGPLQSECPGRSVIALATPRIGQTPSGAFRRDWISAERSKQPMEHALEEADDRKSLPWTHEAWVAMQPVAQSRILQRSHSGEAPTGRP